MKWSENFRVRFHDTDEMGIMRPSATLLYMQEAADMQLYRFGPSTDELRGRGLAFILSRLTLSFYTPLYAHEDIVAQTWICESKGLSFNRCFRILRGDVTVAEGSSVWGLVSVADRRLIRVDEFRYENIEPDQPLELDIPKRIRFPRELPMSLIGEHTVVYSEIDFNGHMNNTCYPDMLCNALSDMRGKRVTSLSVNFISEAKHGESLKIYSGSSDGVVYFRTQKPGGDINIEAEMQFENM